MMIANGDKHAFDEFMLKEYETIANAHFDLHAGLRQTFRFYLGLVSIPFTVMAVAFKDVSLSLFHLPQVLEFLFLVTPLAGVLLFLSMINTRFDIVLYTRTVNGVRGYFVMRAGEMHIGTPETYLKLPLLMNIPPYLEGPSRSYLWLFILVGSINSLYFFVFLANFLVMCAATIAAVLLLVGHYVAYSSFSGARELKENNA